MAMKSKKRLKKIRKKTKCIFVVSCKQRISKEKKNYCKMREE